MFTPEGWEWLANWVAGEVRNGALLVVSDGAQSASAPIATVEVTQDQDSYVLTATASFAEGEANFEWKDRSIKLGDGTVIDSLREDLGRKAQGAEWDLTVQVTFGP